MKRKKISVIVPCYNDEKSVVSLCATVREMFGGPLKDYDYDIIYADDDSADGTRAKVRELCAADRHVRAVFNMANFGFSRNVFSALQESDGDAAFLVFGDLQDPPELLPEFVRKWEAGSKVVVGRKIASDESHIMNWWRNCYYRVIRALSEKPQIEEFNGYGLYDRRFIEVLRNIGDVQPYLKTVVSEYAPDCASVEYRHHKSGRGRSNFNFYKNYDFAMEGITSSTKKLLRASTYLGAGLGIISVIYALYVLIRKLTSWNTYPAGLASIMIGVFILGSAELFFIGILGEYVLSINTRTMRKPRVIVDERIGFDEEPEKTDDGGH
ncbi:MAG: glycosyltransferase [Lachnospiraceae bacterium]|nr:glycosyltransferase [Lachnospiraceae bacterium]